jgi:adenosylcobinamide kinase/adenosylcobinamide-phosphate guanylyltransferase
MMASRGLDWKAEDEDLMAEDEVLERCGKVEAEAMRTIEALRESVPVLVVVSNEVGMGLVPPFRLGRIFRDIAGRLNQRLAAEADEVFMVMAGLPVRLKPWRVGEW